MRLAALCPVLCILAVQVAFAQSQPRGDPPQFNINYETARFERIATAVPTEQQITIDGVLDEPAWELAEPAGNFVQWEPLPGAPESEPTEARFLYDSENLYIGVYCYDSEPDRIVVNELQEDFSGAAADGFGVVLDTLNDDRSGFMFSTNPAGAKRDRQIANDGEVINNDWDGVWDVGVTRTDKGWIAEYVIPFKTLRFSSSETQVWGLNMFRRIRRKNENNYWSPLPRRYRAIRVSMAGTLTGLEGIRQGRNIKVKPFTIGGVRQVRSDGELTSDSNFDGGVDIKYGVTSRLTLDLTYRTDFSQVEVDEQQVNLSRFSLFFPEKREFFLENSGIFAFGQPVALGRRGRGANNLIPFFSRRIGLSSDGTPAPIVGGARLSGSIGSYDLGLLSMKTESLDSKPGDTFAVGRLKKKVMRSSWVGALFTSRDSTEPGDYNRVYGLDTRFRFFDRLNIAGYLLQSETPGKEGKDQARQIEAGWTDNDLSFGVLHHEVGKNFNPEMGFIRRRNTQKTAASFSWRPRTTSSRLVRNLSLTSGINYFAGSDDATIETREQSAGFGVFFENGASFNVGAHRTFDRLVEPFQIRPDISISEGDYSYDDFFVSYNADGSRAITGNIRYTVGEFWDGRRSSFSGSLDLKPDYHLNIDLNYSRNRIRLAGGSFTTNLLGTRVLYAVSSKMFFNAFLQYNTDSNQLSTNIRFNIIHHPLSDLFIVYTDRRDTLSNRIIDRAFVVKFTQLFNF